MAQEPNQSRPQGPPRRVPARSHQALFAPTQAEQRTARIMGAWFLGTFLFSIPAFWFYDPFKGRDAMLEGSDENEANLENAKGFFEGRRAAKPWLQALRAV